MSPALSAADAARPAPPQRGRASDLFSAFEDAVIGMTLVDPDHRPLRINRAFCDFLGYSREQLLARTMLDVVHPDDIAEQRRQRARLLAGEIDSYRLEKRYVHADGHVVWADFSCKLVRDENGLPLHFISQVVDITHRKETELALARSEARLGRVERRLHDARALAEMAGQIGRLGGWGFEVGAPTLMLSPEARAVFGVRPDFLATTEAVMALFAEHDRPRLRAVLRNCLQGGSPFDIEAQAATTRGGRIWVRVICEAEWDDAGKVRRLHGALQDVTESKQAQQALQESQRTLSALMSNLPGMAYRCMNRPDWPLLFVSEGALALTGHTPQALIAGQPEYGDLIHPEDRAKVWAEVQRGIDAKRQFQLTYRIHTAAGELKWVWEQGSGVYGEDGQLRWLEGFVTDVTRSQEAQREIERLNASLEEHVAQRTQELRVANEELEAMAYSIAHDLRAPMTALHGFSQLLEESLTGLDPRSAHYFARIKSNVSYMSELTDALLSLAGLSSVPVVRQPIDLAEIARETLRRLHEIEPARVVHADIAASLPARGDAALLQRVMANLVGNAWKFSRPKPVTRIAVGSEPQADGSLAYFVRDEGVGFDMAHAANLFGAFRRLHPGDFEGTGIGLALVRKIINRHGGRVWAQSQPGAGTTIYFTLSK